MRGKQEIEAYLDDYNIIKFYFSKNSYYGQSSMFYLKKEDGTTEKLLIKDKQEYDSYILYELEVNNIEIGENYFVEHEYARKTPLIYGLIVKTKLFDETYQYTKNDLGATFHNGTTTFKVFAPTAYKIQLITKENEYYMNKEKGIFTIVLPFSMHNKPYKYRIYCNGTIKETIDPYCIKTTYNNTYSIAYDTKTLKDDKFIPLKKYTDAVIYEASVADFTAQLSENPSTYSAMCQNQCLNHLKEIGITHLQLLPITSCGSTDDYNLKLHYNWGYDVTHFQAVSNRYAIKDAVLEFKTLIETYHKNNIAINLDVVFNHVHDFQTSPLQILVPYYYFQIDCNGNLSNASYCGNDYDSTMYMARKLIIDSCLSWVNNFKVDGFRFDLMGIIDINTMNEVYRKCCEINPYFMLYGEGWNMPSLLSEDKRATINNQSQMPNIAFFNDYFRDVIKGKEKGYLTGASFFGDLAQTAFLCSNYNDPSQSINYLECHDNMTLYDHVEQVCNEGEEINQLRMKLLIGGIIISYGIPFIHSGLEYGKSKNGLDNTYRDNSGINNFDWNFKNHMLMKFMSKLIQIRKKYPELRYSTKKEVQENVSIKYIYEDIIAIESQKILIIFNPTYYNIEYNIKGYSLIDDVKIDKLNIEAHNMYVIEKDEDSSSL